MLKKISLSLALVACLAQAAKAVSAYPGTIRVKQADGTWLSVVMRGDEKGHWMMTADNIPLAYNAATCNYDYAVWSGGMLKASGVKATEKDQRTAEVNAFLKKQNFNAIEQSLLQCRQNSVLKSKKLRVNTAEKAGYSIQDERLTDFPTTGEVHPLVILVQFADTKFSTTGDDVNQFYQDMFNKPGFTYTNGANGSVRDFYIDTSNGQFQPYFDVVGPITLPQKFSYYGTNKGSTDNPERLEEFVREACQLADETVDFSKYDLNGDGYVDNVYFYFAGYGEADSGEANTIWPHSTTYEQLQKDASLTVKSLQLDGVKIGKYTCSNEINGTIRTHAQHTGIGTFVHEFGHVLGLADYYDTYYGSATFAPGAFDTMASGSYNNTGNTPPAFSAYERACLGWTSLEELNAGTDTLTVLPELKESNKAYRVSVNGTKGNEFFVLENRQQKGWDSYIPGHGMLLWHIDYDEDAWTSNMVNITGSHQRVDIVEADDRRTESTQAGDPFPGTSNVTQWQLTSWAGDKILSLDDIEEKNGVVSLMQGDLNLKLATPQINFQEVADSSVVLSWGAVPMAKEYILNVNKLLTEGKKPVAAFTGKTFTDAGELTVDGLEPETSYEFSLVASRGSYTSDEFTQCITTQAIPFSKYYVTELKADAITEKGFTASWTGIDATDDYEVTLSKMVYAKDTTSQGYDFSSELDGLPSGWSTDGSLNLSYYGEQTPSLRLNKAGSNLKVAYADQRISSLSFYARTSSSTRATLVVEAMRDGVWYEEGSIEGGKGDVVNGKVYTFNFENADSVRISLSQRTSGAFFIDDVYAGCHALQYEPLSAYNGLSTHGQTSCQFTGLESGCRYALEVRGKQGDMLSYGSQKLIVIVGESTGIANIANTAISQGILYDLSGRKMTKNARHLNGIYIKNGKKVVLK